MLRKTILLFSVLATGVAVLFILKAKLTYEAVSVVRVSPEALEAKGASILDYTKKASSRAVLEKAAAKLRLQGPSGGALLENLSVTDGRDGTVRIAFRASHPDFAAAAANAIAQAFKAVDLEDSRDGARSTQAFLKRRIGLAEQRLPELQKQIEDLEGSEQIDSSRRGEFEAHIGELKQKQAQLMETYTEKHPDVVSLQTQISDLENQMKELPQIGDPQKLARLKEEFQTLERQYRDDREATENARLEEASLPGNVEVLALAIPPQKPLPSRNKKIGLCLILTLFILFLAILRIRQ